MKCYRVVAGLLLSVSSLLYAQTTTYTAVRTTDPISVYGMKWRGTWSNGTNYDKNDVVLFNGISYISTVVNNLSQSPSTSTSSWVATSTATTSNGSGGGITNGTPGDFVNINSNGVEVDTPLIHDTGTSIVFGRPIGSNDTVNNSSDTWFTGSNGDATCPVSVPAGGFIRCVRNGRPQISFANGVWVNELTFPSGTPNHLLAVGSDGVSAVDSGTTVGGGGTSGVSSVAAPSGSWPSWLAPTITNPSTTPSLTVAASPIPNSALANSSTTINNVACPLGQPCTIPVGGGASLPAQMFYASASDTIASIESQCSGLCTYVVTIPQTITLAADHTLSSNVQLQFAAGGKWTVAGGHTLTIPGNVTGTLNQHFAGGTVVFGSTQAVVPVEWFGAVGDWNGSTGTDNTAAIQAAINSVTSGVIALQAQSYEVTSTLNITHNNTGIRGVRADIPYDHTSPMSSSIIVSTSPSADIIYAHGSAGTSDLLQNLLLQDFTVKRSVTPSGTASGIYLNYTFAARVLTTSSYDSVYDYRIHGSFQGGLGEIANNLATNGNAGVSQASQTIAGFFLDSLDGVANQTIVMDNNTFCCGAQASGQADMGIMVKGSAINDLVVDKMQVTGATRGIDIEYTGSGALGTATDLHFTDTVADGCGATVGGSCVFVSGIPNQGVVDFEGGWYANGGDAAPVIDIENSTGVTVRGAQILTVGGPNMVGVNINGGYTNKIQDNTILNLIGTNAIGLSITNSNVNSVTGNYFLGGTNSGTPVPEFILLGVNSYKNLVSGNIFNGWANYAVSNYYDFGTNASSVGTSNNAAAQVHGGDMLMNVGVSPYASPFEVTTTTPPPAIAFTHQWLMKDGSGSTFADTGSSPANMTANNITWGTVSGFPGTAATFNGVNSSGATAAPLSGLDISTPFTMNIWADITSFPAGQTGAALFAALATDGTYKGIRLVAQSNLGVDILLVNTLSGTAHYIEKASVANSFTTGSIHMFTVTSDGSGTAAGVNVYVDGNLLTPASTTDSLAGASFAPTVPMVIGADVASPGAYLLAGTAADARIYNSAFSQSQITALFTAGVQ